MATVTEKRINNLGKKECLIVEKRQMSCLCLHNLMFNEVSRSVLLTAGPQRTQTDPR